MNDSDSVHEAEVEAEAKVEAPRQDVLGYPLGRHETTAGGAVDRGEGGLRGHACLAQQRQALRGSCNVGGEELRMRVIEFMDSDVVMDARDG